MYDGGSCIGHSNRENQILGINKPLRPLDVRRGGIRLDHLIAERVPF
jgi:hypothetical protein